MNRFFILLPFSLLVVAFTVLSQSGVQFNFDVKGTIRDKSGAVIPGLSLQFDNGGVKKYAFTDINGDFEIALPTRDYVLTAPELGEDRFKAFIKIVQKGPNPAHIDLFADSSQLCEPKLAGYSYPAVIKSAIPVFPPAAVAVRASGIVTIQVTAGAEGKVIAAEAVSGHPLLRASSLIAARKFEFEATAGEPVKLLLRFVFLTGSEKKTGVLRIECPYRITVYKEPILIEQATSYKLRHN